MQRVTEIDFQAALVRLQRHLDRHVQILISFHGTFGGVSMEGRLKRVRTLPPDNTAVAILIDDRQSLMLDPVDTETLLCTDADGEESLTFNLPSGVEAIFRTSAAEVDPHRAVERRPGAPSSE